MCTSPEEAPSDQLTLIITTSPTLSAPSTELLSTVIKSFRAHCASLLRCKVIVVFDAYEQVTSHPRLKKGHVTPKGAESYSAYKENVKNLFLQEYAQTSAALKETRGEAEYGSPASTKPVPFTASTTPDGRVAFIEAQGQRLGFGLAVRTALRAVDTPYVWVHQHDWALIYDIPIAPLLEVMRASEGDDARPIKYVCLPSGRRTSYATSDQVMRFPELRSVASALTAGYEASSGVVPLTPMFFWHDKPHVASTAHYLGRVFPSRLAMMRGAFIEDTIGQKARRQMKEGRWAKWATWLYHPEAGKQVCLKHLHGRTWRGEGEEKRMRDLYREKNRAALQQSAEADEGDMDIGLEQGGSDAEDGLEFWGDET
jgi:feruloyl esterase